MDHMQVLRRAAQITWRYRALWVFGIILALTAGGGGGNGGSGYNFGGGNFDPRQGDLRLPDIPPEIVSVLIAVGIGSACLFLVFVVVGTIARYVAETALIRLVDDHEATGELRRVGQGFRMGWSRAAFRLFLIDLVIGVPVAVAFILLFLAALLPLLVWLTDSTAARIVGTLAAAGLFILVILVAILVAIALTLLKHFFRRACALEGLGVIDSIRQGYAVARRHLKDVAIMWLLMVGVGLGVAIVMLLVTFLLLAAGVLVGGLPALVVGGLASLFFEEAVPWILGAAVGVPIFLLVVIVPALLLGGLVEVFRSSVWTLTYRNLRAMEGQSSLSA
jgi:hypothetical protein